MHARRLGLSLAFAIGLAATLAATAFAIGSAGSSGGAVTLAQLRGVNFVNVCGFSHRLPDDPIVAPGRPGASHDHSFVGARTTSASSTLESLLASPSTCERPGHTAAYWMPTLLANGQSVAPGSATIYYRRSTLDVVRSFPPGFRMIAGDAMAQTPQSLRVTSWNCGVHGGVRPQSDVPVCPTSKRTALRLHVTFPSCWDGTNLDSPNHKSHVAYPTRGRCPSTHPVGVPAITLIYRYPAVTGSISLASGNQYSAHADFFNSWNQNALESLIDGCLNALRHCQKGT